MSEHEISPVVDHRAGPALGEGGIDTAQRPYE